jgi:long-chain acyl-CoA synthetase
MGIGQTIQKTAQAEPNKPAMIYENTIISYKQFYDTVNRLRMQLQRLISNGKQPEIALCLGNEPAFLEVFFATVTLGGVAMPLDPKWSERETTEVLAKTKPDIIITSQHFQKTAAYAPPAAVNMETLKEEPGQPRETRWPSFSEEAFYIGFTSGTTGVPKHYIRNHTSWLTSFQAAEEAFHLTKDATIFAPGPLCYSLSLCSALHALHLGATFHLTPSFQPAKLREALQSQTNSFLFAVPSMLHAIVRTSFRSEKNITFISAGDQLHVELIQQLKQNYPAARVIEYYGASELSYVGYAVHESEEKASFHPFPGVHLSVWTENNKRAAPGEVGQIYVESPLVFSGYPGLPDETKKVLTPRGATVGDIGSQATDGSFSIIGRKKNMLITGGVNIYPEEIEQVIKELPFISEAIVIGEESALRGQRLIALIQWEGQPAPQTLREHCKAHLAEYKIPKKFVAVATFPRTSNGKIDRTKIAERI